MNRSKIEWVDDTWNPITGCYNGCDYCYAKRNSIRFAGDIRKNLISPNCKIKDELYVLEEPFASETGGILNYPFGFLPTFHKYRLNYASKRKNGCNILVGEMGDMFGPWVPDEYIEKIFLACEKNPKHNYFFQTQYPERYNNYGVPKGTQNLWYGTTITKEEEIDRLEYLPTNAKKFMLFEPLLEEVKLEYYDKLFSQLDWIIVGAETGNRKNKIIPRWEWIKAIERMADKYNIPIFMKESLNSIGEQKELKKEYPILKKEISEKTEKRLYSHCCMCKNYMKKNEMITLSARSCRGEQPKQYGFMCKKCFKDFCKCKGLKIPNLKNMEVN